VKGDPQIVRKGFGLKQEIAGQLSSDYASELVDRARAADYRLAWPGLAVRIAKEFGFCYGVERAIDYAYETRKKFPDRRLFLTGEIIHNPRVNLRLREIGYLFLDGSYGSTARYADLVPEDVVLLPAFGVTTGMLDELKQVGCLLVDTTCGSVLNVWRNVEKYARDGFTCLIHGKWKHEETRATASRALLYPEGRTLVVLDMAETEEVCRYIRGEGDRASFLERFANAISPGFDPDRHLERIGMANQTTMLSTESMAIANRVREAMRARWGEAGLEGRFRSFDTICSATQDRQDAVKALLAEPPQLMIVIGGFNSSNTGHLTEMCAERLPTFHIEEAGHIESGSRIVHLPVGSRVPVVTEDWWPAEVTEIGITAGASTPDREIGRVIERLLQIRGIEDAPRA
jgi:4-hydroxy-3-methylbut-2-enyl diphosphate reductase